MQDRQTKLNLKYYSIISQWDEIKSFDLLKDFFKSIKDNSSIKIDAFVSFDNNYLLEKIIKKDWNIYFWLYKVQYDNFPKKWDINKWKVDIISIKLWDKDVLLHPFYISLNFKEFDFNYKWIDRILKWLIVVAKKWVDLPSWMLWELFNSLYIYNNIKTNTPKLSDDEFIKKYNDDRMILSNYVFNNTDIKVVLNKQAYSSFVEKWKSYKKIELAFSEKAKEIPWFFSLNSNVFKNFWAAEIKITIKSNRWYKNNDSYLNETKTTNLVELIKRNWIEWITKWEITFYDKWWKPDILELMDYILKSDISVLQNKDWTINEEDVVDKIYLHNYTNLKNILNIITNN